MRDQESSKEVLVAYEGWGHMSQPLPNACHHVGLEHLLQICDKRASACAQIELIGYEHPF